MQAPISILIIEDNLGDQLLLHENLKTTRLIISEVSVTSTLSGALELLKERPFSVIFLDLFLPDSSGLESFTELIKFNSKIPVIIYSGLDDEQIALKAISLGAQDFLIKADYTDKLLEKIIKYSIERKNNSDALQESNAKFALISKATHDMVWDWDLATDEVHRNAEGWKKIFKTTTGEEGKKQDWPSKVHPDDRERVQEIVTEFINSDTQQLFEIEFRVLKDDNTVGYIKDRGYIIRDDKDKAIRIIGASQDITERRNAEEKVLLSEQRFKSLVQNSSDLLAILNAEGNYIYVSPTSKKILGYEPEFFMGKNAFDFMHEDDVQKMATFFASRLSEKFVEAPLFRFKNADGNWRWIESSITNLMDDPAVNGIVINSRDVTDKKIAADELQKLSMIARETVNGVAIRDKDQNLLWVNNAFTKMYGYQLEEVVGKNPIDFLPGPETDMEVVNFVKVQLTKKEPFVFELLYYSKAGNKIFVRAQVQPIFDENGNLIQTFALHTDITQEKYLEEKVEQEKITKQKEITEAVIAAHENERTEIGRELHDNINQLLAASKLYNEMAKTDVKNRSSLLSSSANYTMSAIDEIRKLSKTLITPSMQETGLAKSVKHLAEGIMHVDPIQIKLVVKDFDEEILNEKFKLNIYRIIQEQVNNVLKHASAKTIAIEMQQTGEKLFITIKDDGVGFDTSKKTSGVGMSNIVSRAALYKGDVKLKSSPGNGCLLFISFVKSGCS